MALDMAGEYCRWEFKNREDEGYVSVLLLRPERAGSVLTSRSIESAGFSHHVLNVLGDDSGFAFSVMTFREQIYDVVYKQNKSFDRLSYSPCAEVLDFLISRPFFTHIAHAVWHIDTFNNTGDGLTMVEPLGGGVSWR